MKKTIGIILQVSSLSFLLVSCGIFKKSDEAKNETNTRSELAGTWHSDCVAETVIHGLFARHEINMGADMVFRRTTDHFTDSQCQTKTYTTTIHGEYRLLNAGQVGTKQVDFTMRAAAMMPATADMAKTLNDAQECGHTDWQANQDQSVIDTPCTAAKITNGLLLKDVYDLRNGDLFFGRPSFVNDGKAPETRPTSVELTVPFHKA